MKFEFIFPNSVNARNFKRRASTKSFNLFVCIAVRVIIKSETCKFKIKFVRPVQI